MKIKGTIHLIHKEDNQWIFKYEEDGKPLRIPFVFYTGKYEDGQELDCYIETLSGPGIQRAKPLFPIPDTLQNESQSIELP